MQTLGANLISVPVLFVPNECDDEELEIVNYQINPIEVPEGAILSDLVSFDEETVILTVHQVIDLSIMNKHVVMSLLAFEAEGRVSNYTLRVAYESDGP